MNFEEKVQERVVANIGGKAVTFATKCESTSENMTTIVSQNNWLIAGIQEMETHFSKRLVKLEIQVQELRQILEQEVKVPDLKHKRKMNFSDDEEEIEDISNGCPAFSKENLKMIRILTRSSSYNHMTVTAAEYELEQIEKNVQNFQVPRFAWKELYHISSMHFRQKYYLKCVDEAHMVPLFTKRVIEMGKRKGYRFIHTAAVQVVIKIMARKNLGGKVPAIVQDRRLTNFRQKVLLSLLEIQELSSLVFS